MIISIKVKTVQSMVLVLMVLVPMVLVMTVVVMVMVVVLLLVVLVVFVCQFKKTNPHSSEDLPCPVSYRITGSPCPH